MPVTWRINIKKNPRPRGPALFEFDQTPQVEVGDQIVWSNQDAVPHFPTPVDSTFVFMPNQIAAQSTSPAFVPNQTGTIKYVCSLHKNESATIEVVAPPLPSEVL